MCDNSYYANMHGRSLVRKLAETLLYLSQVNTSSFGGMEANQVETAARED